MTEQNNVSLNPKAPEQGERLHRGLSNRHIQLIAIGGAIGTGLFMGSGRAISVAGPSVIFVYMLIGAVIFLVLRAMGEILLSNLKYKSFSDFTTDLVGPMAGFFLGWSYWFMWVVTAVADIIAIVGYLRMWWPDLQAWIPALAVISVLLVLNLVSVKNFGEIEFWFSMKRQNRSHTRLQACLRRPQNRSHHRKFHPLYQAKMAARQVAFLPLSF